jgi:hypothetical protein
MFPTPFSIGPGGSATFRGVEVAECPFCGGGAFIPDGLYEFAGSIVDLVKANGIQRAQLRRLQAILEQAQKETKGEGSTQELGGIEQRIAQEVPEAKPLLPVLERFLRANGYTMAALGVLIAIISAVFAYPSWKAATTTSVQKSSVPTEQSQPATTRAPMRRRLLAP